MSAVRDRLRDAPLPGEAEAAARSWPVVEAALAERSPSAPRRRMPMRLVLVGALICLALATALSPAGAWIGDRFEKKEPARARPAFAALPPGGSVLAITRTGAYAVRPDGGARRLGAFSEVGWSPHGWHAVGVDGRRLVAVTPTETTKWTLARPRALHHPAWSLGDGFFVAYLETARSGGATLRVVNGKGDPATSRLLRRRAAPVTPAWRPGRGYVLTYARASGAIETLDVITGNALWRARVGAPVRDLAWTRGGRRLVALSSHAVTVLDQRGHVLRTLRLPGVGRELAVHPSGRSAAVAVGGGGRAAAGAGDGGAARLLDVPLGGGPAKVLFQGNVDGVAWSQDGRWLLVGWRGAGQWLLLGPHGRIRLLHGVTTELGAAGGFPRVAGWCCED
jgi:hypothetical protein